MIATIFSHTLLLATLAAGLGLCPAPAAALPLTHPVLGEVVYDAPGADGPGVFTELHGPPGMALGDWALLGVNGSSGEVYRTVPLSGAVLPADGILVLASAAAAGAVLAARDLVAAVDWQNGPDAVLLRDPAGLVADALQYGDAGVHGAGEGTPAPDVAPGSSLARRGFGLDSDDNARDFAVLEVPTPGRAPRPAAPPRATPLAEPPVAALLIAALAVLGSLRRSRRRRRHGRRGSPCRPPRGAAAPLA